MSSHSIPGYQPTGTYLPFAAPPTNANTPFRTTAGLNDSVWLHPERAAGSEKLVKEYLVVNTSERDRSVYPNAGQCVIRLADSARGSISKVRSVRLVSGILPDVSGTVIVQPYLVLRIPELSNGHFVSNSSVIEGAFSILQLDRPLQNEAFLSLKGDLNEMSQVTPPSSTINQLTISILKYDGTIFDFNNGIPDNGLVSNATKNLTLFFEIQREQ